MSIDPRAGLTSYNDFQGIAQMRARAQQDASGSIKEVAAQFEAQFIIMMLKSMRDAVESDDLFSNHQIETFQGMFDQEIAQKLSARAGGIGLADMIARQLERDTVGKQNQNRPANEAGLPLDKPTQAQALHSDAQKGFTAPMRPGDARALAFKPEALETPMPQTPTAAILAARGQRDESEKTPQSVVRKAEETSPVHENQAADEKVTPAYWESPEEFVAAVLPYAKQAAARIGVSPKVLVAQSALETGWGRHVPTDEQGQPSYNFFGIKADPSWNGPKQMHNTLEFESGVMVQKREAFRKYRSVGDAFHGLVDFLEQNPRYQQALRNTHNPDQFAKELQKAGYATDPNYADKISSIMRSSYLQAL